MRDQYSWQSDPECCEDAEKDQWPCGEEYMEPDTDPADRICQVACGV